LSSKAAAAFVVAGHPGPVDNLRVMGLVGAGIIGLAHLKVQHDTEAGLWRWLCPHRSRDEQQCENRHGKSRLHEKNSLTQKRLRDSEYKTRNLQGDAIRARTRWGDPE
jgi:hypothetical protein